MSEANGTTWNFAFPIIYVIDAIILGIAHGVSLTYLNQFTAQGVGAA
jgi:hypothetical protein